MRGYPKHLNTKADYEYVRQNYPKSKWQKDFEKLLTSAKDWFNVGAIEGDGVTDETHMVVKDESAAEGEQDVKAYQYEYRENPGAKIFKIGYTLEEVEKILAEG